MFPVKPLFSMVARSAFSLIPCEHPPSPPPNSLPAQLHEATIFFSQAWAGTVHLSVLAEDLVLVFWKWFTVPASNQWG